MEVEASFDTLSHALAVALHSASSQNDRRQATHYIEEFKEASPLCELIGLKFFSQATYGNTSLHGLDVLPLRLFGLQLLEHCIKFRWNTYSPHSKNAVKTMLLDNILPMTLPITLEAAGVKQKVGLLVAEVMKREWPQNWPDLIDSLLKIGSVDDTRTQLMLVVFQVFIEEVMEFDVLLPADRKRDLRLAIHECLPVLFPTIHESLNRGFAGVEAGNPASLSLALSCFQVLVSLVGWAPFTMIYEHGFIKLLCQFLQLPSVRVAACNCLRIVYDRKGPKEEREQLLQILPFTSLLIDSIPTVEGRIIDEDDVFTKGMCEIMVSIGTNQIPVQWSPAMPFLSEYVTGLLRLSRHPSLRVLSNCMITWNSILRSPNVVTSCVIGHFGALLELCAMRIRKPSFPRSYAGADPEILYCNYDFNSRKDFDEYFSVLRNNTVSVVRLAAGLAPVDSAEFAIRCLLSVLQPVFDNTFTPANHELFSTVVLFVESVFQGVWTAMHSTENKDEARDLKVLAHMSMCCEGLLGLNSAIAAVSIGRISLLQVLFPIISRHEAYLRPILDILFAALESVDPPGCPRTVSTENIKLRRVAGAALVHLCQKPPPCLVGYLHEIVQRTEQTIAKSEISDGNKRIMLEALLSAGNLLPGLVEHEGYMMRLLGGVCADWQSPGLSGVVSSAQQFVQFAGLGSLGCPSVEQRDMLTNASFGIVSALRCTRARDHAGMSYATGAVPPLRIIGVGGTALGGDGLQYAHRAILSLALPNITALFKTLHSIWSERDLGIVSDILDLRIMEAEALVGDVSAFDADTLTPEDKWIDATRYWLGSMREACYMMIGNACKLGLAYEQHILDHLLCEAALPTMHIRHQKLFVKHILNNFVMYAPRDQSLFSSLSDRLGAIYSHFLRLLAAEWERRRALASGGGASCFEASREPCLLSEGTLLGTDLREIAICKLTDDLAQDVIVHVCSVFANAIDVHTDDPATHVYTLGATAKLYLQLPQLVRPIFSLLTQAMTSPSPVACRTASDLLLAILPILRAQLEFQPFISDVLLRATFGGLSAHGQHSDCETTLLNILCDIVSNCAGDATSVSLIQAVAPNISPPVLMTLVGFLRDRAHGKGGSAKMRRLELRKHFAGIIGVNIGQQLRNHIDIRSLEISLLLPTRKIAVPSLDEIEGRDFGIGVLFAEQ